MDYVQEQQSTITTANRTENVRSMILVLVEEPASDCVGAKECATTGACTFAYASRP